MSEKLMKVAGLLMLMSGLGAVASVPDAGAQGYETNIGEKATIWDAMNKYDCKFYAFEDAACPDRPKGKQVLYANLRCQFVRDAIIKIQENVDEIL